MPLCRYYMLKRITSERENSDDEQRCEGSTHTVTITT